MPADVAVPLARGIIQSEQFNPMTGTPEKVEPANARTIVVIVKF